MISSDDQPVILRAPVFHVTTCPYGSNMKIAWSPTASISPRTWASAAASSSTACVRRTSACSRATLARTTMSGTITAAISSDRAREDRRSVTVASSRRVTTAVPKTTSRPTVSPERARRAWGSDPWSPDIGGSWGSAKATTAASRNRLSAVCSAVPVVLLMPYSDSTPTTYPSSAPVPARAATAKPTWRRTDMPRARPMIATASPARPMTVRGAARPGSTDV